MKGKKFLTWLLATLCVGSLALGVACEDGDKTNSSTNQSTNSESVNSETSSSLSDVLSSNDGESSSTCDEDSSSDKESPFIPDESFSSDEHMHTWAVRGVIPPTCLQGGYIVYECTACGEAYVEGEANAIGHDYKVTGQIKNGDYYLVEFSCNCGVILEVEASLKEIVEPTCKTGGYSVYEYSYDNGIGVTVGGTIETDHTDKAHKHTFTDGKHILCVEQGAKINYTEAIKALIEKPVLYWVEGKPATCKEYGIVGGYCSVCDYIITFSLKGEHDYYTITYNPTYEMQGYTVYTCECCGYSYKGDYKDPINQDDTE